jgi:alcohol dehydrogenase class IV
MSEQIWQLDSHHQFEPNHFFYGDGCVEDLPTVLDEIGAERPMLICGENVGANEFIMNRIDEIVGDRLVNTYKGVRSKTPEPKVEEGIEHKREHDADCVISVGGGSASDTAKAIVCGDAEEGRSWDDMKSQITDDGTMDIPALPEPKDPVVALSTTLSAAEVTEAFGVTDFENEERKLMVDEKVRSAACFYDPELVATTPSYTIASSGMNALDHAVEVRYSAVTADNPFYQATSEKAVDLLMNNLEAAVNEGDEDAIAKVLYGSALSALGIIGGYAINHAMNHVVCGFHDISHGDGNSILLQHGIRYNFETVPERVMAIADAAGIEEMESDEERLGVLLSEIDSLQKSLGVPRSMSEAGVDEMPDDHVHEMAEHAAHDPGMAANPRPVTADDAYEILKEAW